MTQSPTFDPDETYIRRWIPELARVGTEHIHAPWMAPKQALDAAGVQLGRDYPTPIVDHALARKRR